MSGLTLLKLGRADDAVLMFSELVEKFPSIPKYRLDLARAYVAIRDPGSAAAECQNMLSMCPECRNDPNLFSGLEGIDACRP